MKKTLRLLLLMGLAAGSAQAQFSPYNRVINVDWNRGASPANDTTANGGPSVFYESPSNTSAAGIFFRNITDGSYKLRALCYGNGLFNLAGDVFTMKNVTTSNALAKFATYNIDGAAAVVKFKFTLDLSGFTGDNVNALIFAFGNNAGSGVMTSSSVPFTTANGGVFGAFRIIKSGNVVTQFRNADGAGQTNTVKRLIMPSASQTVEIFANSTTSPVSYRYRPTDTADSTIAANTYNVYVNGEKHVENFPKVGTTYAESSINALTIALAAANGGTAETVKLSNLQITYPSATLPVSLTSFSGKQENSGIRLNWATASELNNNHFELLRSANGKDFASITTIAGNGTSNQANTYSYLDRAPEAGTNYYKLKQVDNDGKSTIHTQVVAVENALASNQTLSVFLGNNTLSAKFDASEQGNASISLTDLSGKKVLSKTFKADKGINNVDAEITGLAPGIYVATLLLNGGRTSIKVVKN